MDGNCDGNDVETLLLDVVRSRLGDSGKLNKIKSELLGLVLNDVRNGDKSAMCSPGSNSLKSPTQMANHLIYEYLEWMGFQYSKEMFAVETGCGGGTSRALLEVEVGKKEHFDKQLPLLLGMISKLKKDDEAK